MAAATAATAPCATATTAVYARRFVVLAIFSAISLAQALLWITYGTPVAGEAHAAFGLSPRTMQWSLALNILAYILVAPFAPRLIARYGLQAATTAAAAAVAAGAVIRIFVERPGVGVVVVTYVGSFVNGVSSPVLMAAPPLLSSTWFPPRERNVATAISALANFAGGGFGFIVSLPVHTADDLRALLFWEAVCGVGLFVVAAADQALCRATPLLPPAVSAAAAAVTEDAGGGGDDASWTPAAAAAEALSHREDLACLWRNHSFRQLALTYAILCGSYYAWVASIGLIMAPLGYSSGVSAWLGFSAVAAGVVGGVGVGMLLKHPRHYRVTLVTLFLTGVASYTVFALVSTGALAFGDGATVEVSVLFGTCCAGAFVVCAAVAPLFESAIEVTFPMQPIIPGSVMAYLTNVFLLLFLAVGPLVPPESLTWACAAVCLLSIFLVAHRPMTYVRSGLEAGAAGYHHDGDDDDDGDGGDDDDGGEKEKHNRSINHDDGSREPLINSHNTYRQYGQQ